MLSFQNLASLGDGTRKRFQTGLHTPLTSTMKAWSEISRFGLAGLAWAHSGFTVAIVAASALFVHFVFVCWLKRSSASAVQQIRFELI